MKKIAFVITQSEMGGAQKNIVLLCDGLKDEYNITVYAAPGGALEKEILDRNMEFIPVEHMVREINPIKDYKAYKFLKKAFEKENYDVVHCHSSKAGILAREAAYRANIKNIIYTAHGFVFNEPMNNIKKSLYKFLEKFEANKTNSIICVDPKDITIAKNMKMQPKNSLIYIPNGIDFSMNEGNIERKDSSLFTFGLVANFYETKGHRYLIEAFLNLLKDGYKGRLVLIGEGRLLEEMKELSCNNPYIEFWGYKNNAMELMKEFNCFVLSSVKEGFPFVILESIKNKVPVIATKVGAVPLMLEQGELGLLVDKENPEELKNAMIYAINNYNELEEKAEKAYEVCKEKYSIHQMIKETKNLYDII